MQSNVILYSVRQRDEWEWSVMTILNSLTFLLIGRTRCTRTKGKFHKWHGLIYFLIINL